MEEWKTITPQVNQQHEFHEIASDFGDPLEIVREAISNSYDHNASFIKIDITVEKIDGYDKLVMQFIDDGDGMSRERLEQNFWDLGNSSSRADSKKIGEKGHGTKIYLRSDKIRVVTSHDGHTYESICEHAFSDLCANRIHHPQTREIDYCNETGTSIRIEGYNGNEKATYRQQILKDYIYWFTKVGSFENEIPNHSSRPFHVELHCLDKHDEPYYERLDFGHRFPEENSDVDALFDNYGEDAADYFVKRYEFFYQILNNQPHITYDALIYIEGNTAKQAYNEMIKKKADSRTGVYKVSDRYGIWLCKDYMPIQRVNDWIVGFGTGSNASTLLHGFINCQSLNLTANRGSIANTEPALINDLKKELNDVLDKININLYKTNYGVLSELKKEIESDRTLQVEEAGFIARKISIEKRAYFQIKDRSFLVPTNESEVFGLLISLYSQYPTMFEFEPLDYNTTQGIDILARNKTSNPISDCEYWYVELKKVLSICTFNHSFQNIRWIVCWDFSKDIKNGTILESIVTNDKRQFRIQQTDDGKKMYWLDDLKGRAVVPIKVLRLKEMLTEDLGIAIHSR